MTVQSIAVFMGAQFGNDPEYTIIAEKLGQLIAEKKLKLVYGGGRDGLMGATALSTMAHGGEVIGITPNNLAEDAISPEQVTRLIEVDSMSERKDLMMRYADAFVVLPGGFGTLEELAQVLSWAKIGLHDKPLVLLNINGFYDSLWAWLKETVTNGFVAEHELQHVQLFDNIDDTLIYINQFNVLIHETNDD
ncbi:TIGR00730 family Rossman fold protein [Leuconostoc inhae]|uniref:LOG family protein n=1 Tax=Leuconostoc inhae TaxID=178001 RepID=UPI0007DE7455|nr:TIGR00730 family Rossman fold protein [Leuconostoc inhae]CUW12453.1 Lysine decarboxylase family [Leuconostoc inhae]